ncbi:hypothetical protein HYN49_13345 [Flavobacterium pallidum]|uniref:Uncharacterized protein n=1 Tax=Flavobacterium pallidum TaxID=2172098 RepID=A0A2S1SK40_9FLAO|nr:hypothetical protein HYN49_13345 [Flavobacterium pallidum]
MKTKTFNTLTSISMVLTSTVLVIEVVKFISNGFYLDPGIFILMLLALMPIASKFYHQKKSIKLNNLQYKALFSVNSILILLMIWKIVLTFTK